jgi:uncharacterized protein YlxW (UPF0749 family)
LSKDPGATRMALVQELQRLAGFLAENHGLLRPVAESLADLARQLGQEESPLGPEQALAHASRQVWLRLAWLRSRERFRTGTAKPPASPPAAEDAPPYKPDEAALLATVTERFCQSWHYRCALGVAAVTIIAALGGTVAIFGQSVAIWTRVDNVAQSAEARGKEAIAAITTSANQLASEVKQRQSEIAALGRETRDKLALIERDAQAKVDEALSREGQAGLRAILKALETGLIEQRERETQALRTRVADLLAELDTAATTIARLRGTVQAQSLAAEALRDQLDRARLLVGEVDGYLATGRSVAEAARDAARLADAAATAARQAEAERAGAEALRRGADGLLDRTHQAALDLAGRIAGAGVEVSRLTAWAAQNASLPADGDRLRTAIAAFGQQTTEFAERLNRTEATLAGLEGQRQALALRGEGLAPRLAELEAGLGAGRDALIRLTARVGELAERSAQAEGLVPDTRRLNARSAEVEAQLGELSRRNAAIAVELAEVAGTPGALRTGLQGLLEAQREQRAQLENMQVAIGYLAQPQPESAPPLRPAAVTTPVQQPPRTQPQPRRTQPGDPRRSRAGAARLSPPPA